MSRIVRGGLAGLEGLERAALHAIAGQEPLLLDRCLEVIRRLLDASRQELYAQGGLTTSGSSNRRQLWAACAPTMALRHVWSKLLTAAQAEETPEASARLLKFALVIGWQATEEGWNDLVASLVMDTPAFLLSPDALAKKSPRAQLDLAETYALYARDFLRVFALRIHRHSIDPWGGVVGGEAVILGWTQLVHTLDRKRRQSAAGALPQELFSNLASVFRAIEEAMRFNRREDDDGFSTTMIQWALAESGPQERSLEVVGKWRAEWLELFANVNRLALCGDILRSPKSPLGLSLLHAIAVSEPLARLVATFTCGRTSLLDHECAWDRWDLEGAPELVAISIDSHGRLRRGFAYALGDVAGWGKPNQLGLDDSTAARLRPYFGKSAFPGLRSAVLELQQFEWIDADRAGRAITRLEELRDWTESKNEAFVATSTVSSELVERFSAQVAAAFATSSELEEVCSELGLVAPLGASVPASDGFGQRLFIPREYFIADTDVHTEHLAKQMGQNLREELDGAALSRLVSGIEPVVPGNTGTLLETIASQLDQLTLSPADAVILAVGGLSTWDRLTTIEERLKAEPAQGGKVRWANPGGLRIALLRNRTGPSGVLVAARTALGKYRIALPKALEPYERAVDGVLTIGIREPSALEATSLRESPVEDFRTRPQLVLSVFGSIEFVHTDPKRCRWVAIPREGAQTTD